MGYVEQATILDREWNECRNEAFGLKWNQVDIDQVISKIDMSNMDIKFIDQVINHKIKVIKNLLNDPMIQKNERLRMIIMKGIIFASVAVNAPKGIQYHAGEEFHWKGLTLEYQYMD